MKHHKMNNRYILTLAMMLAAMLAGGNATAQVVVKGNVYGGGNEGPVLTNSEVAIEAGTVENYVFGGGNKADVSGAVTVSMSGGTVTLDVYGGGALANTNIDNWQSDALVAADYQAVSLAEGASLVGYYSKSGDTYTLLTSGTAPTGGGTYYKKRETIVILTGGTVNGDVYGGGLGDADNAALVYGEVTVNIGATTGGDNPTYSGDATIGGSVFGCNNLNGTPKSDVVVNIYKTHHEDSNKYPANVTTLEGLNSLPNTDDQYAIKAVYGGGNLASYTPVAGSTTPHSATVHVYACDDNTVRTVYGGGNAADVGTTGDGAITANTNVIIEGGRFDRIFGGGNGYSETNNHSDPTAANYNPGANIYGTATTEIRGGLYNQVFGGSNQYGNITTASLIINQVCDYLLIKESFGGANEAELNGDVTTTLACGGEGIQIGNFYGGSNMADINGDVTLNVEGGTYVNVFGGSKGRLAQAAIGEEGQSAYQPAVAAKAANISGDVTLNLYGGTMENAFGGSDANGNIGGKITVNMLDKGGSCGLVVHNIYGGGRDAAYTPTTPGAYPEVNLIHGTVSKKAVTEGENTTYTGGNVFGGGLGSTAIVTSSPKVTVGYDSSMSTLVPDGFTLTTASVTVQGDVYGGGEEANVTGSVTMIVQQGSVENMTITTTVNGDVYGGGALANTNTDQTTNLGTEEAPAHHSTTVTMGGGTVNNVYGGGLGDATHEALVNGAVAVTVNGGTVSNVFGCNNINGAPQSTVVVTVEQTASTMAVTNVFGGGNLAQYTGDPEVNIINGTVSGNVYGGGKGELASGDNRGQKGKVTGNPQVTIGDNVDGHTAHVTGDVYGGGDAANVTGTPVVVVNDCATTIGYLYGGGNAADVTGTNITVNGGSITQAYGGGHGDKNVTEQPLKYADVNGNVVFNVYGGTIVQVFAGSNSKGSITGTSALTVNKTGTCDMKIGEVYGGGNEAAGNAGTVTIGCTGTWTTDDDNTDSNNGFHDKHNSTDNRIGYELEGIGTVYGGANQADIGAAGDGNASNITLNINSGIVENVFGGNNTSGTIHGTITVNIEKDNAAACAENWYVGNVYGGGNLAPYTGNPAVNILNGTVSQNVYGGGKGNTAVVTGNPVVHVGDADEAYCAIVSGDVYGGGDAAAVTGNTSVVYDDSHASSTVTNLFGGGNAAGVSGTSAVTLTNGVVTAGAYGGCNTSGSVGDVEMSLNGGTVGVNGTTTDVVYGGGYGHGTSTTGDIGITLNGTTVYGNLYGGSALGAVGASSKTTTITISSNTLHGTVFGGGMGSGSGDETKATTNGDIEINYNTANTNLTGLYGGANVNGTVAGNITVNVKANAGASGDGNSRDIFGGGYGENTSTSGNVTVNVGDNTNTTAPVVYGDVYGGSALGQVNASTSTTTVNILSGTLHGNTYGGGLGEANVAEGGNITTDNSAKGQVNGNVVVNIGATDGAATPAYTGFATIDGSVYGCNNTNGSPKGSVTVNIYKTAHTTTDAASYTENDGTNGAPTYAIANVFGGGRQADYSPVLDTEGGTTSSKRATVYVHGCDNTIEDLFGGGDAAAAYGVVTIVDGGRYDRVFGGGNGEVSAANIGAGGTNLQVHGGKISQLFGGSNTSGTITGNMGVSVDNTGPCAVDPESMYVAEFFCGNNLANIGTSENPVNVNATIGCGTKFGDVYGGCNLADIYGNVTLTIEGGEMNNVYGGSKGQAGNTAADAADITGNVTLNIYGGNIKQNAFGGSNINGNITGSITVNMDWSQASTDCNSASDLYVGNVYGASNLAAYHPTTAGAYPEVNIKNGTVSGNVFGGGLGATAKVYSNPKVTIGDITEGHESYVATVSGNVYGGGSAAMVGDDESATASTNSTTVLIQKANSSVNKVFGGGAEAGVTGTTSVTINAGTVSAGLYGGCDASGTVVGNVTVNVNGGNIGTNDANSDDGVFGGGFGSSTKTGANVEVTIGPSGDGTGPTIYGDVYGGSALGSVNNTADELNAGSHTYVTLNKGTVNGNIYGGGLGQIAVDDDPDTTDDESLPAIEAKVWSPVTVTVNGGTVANVFGCNNFNGSPMGTVTVTINNNVSGNVYGGGNQAAYEGTGGLSVSMTNGTVANVFGGGLGTTATVNGSTSVGISGGTVNGDVYGGGSEADVTQNVSVSITGGRILNDVYGGGALASTNTDNWTGSVLTDDVYEEITGLTVGKSLVIGYYTRTGNEGSYTYTPTTDTRAKENTTYYRLGTTYTTTISLTGGIIGHLADNTANDYLGGNVYGGGLGRLANGDDATAPGYLGPVEAMVYGDIDVTLDGTAFIQRLKSPGANLLDVPFSGRLFGCNNLNGTPKGNVKVTVLRTIQVNGSGTPVSEHSTNKFDVHSVYGGGNLASYLPVTGKETKVMIDGCGETSIEKVFGGGNSASVPSTDVLILGSYYIGYAFGGGNGADKIWKNGSWDENGGAPVNGNATITAIGGKIGQVFAGSDTKGDINGTATVRLKGKEGFTGDNYTSDCRLQITNSYGAGRGADINGNVNFIVSGCTNDEIENVFGGSFDANIRGSITLTITSGYFTQVYGGNDHGGNIGGDIIVNIEESDECNPIVIQHLYGGGREAAYPGAGAKKVTGSTGEGENIQYTYENVTEGNIQVNIKSATRIGDVYGGCYRAQVTGNTEVNINMIKGSWAKANGRVLALPEGYAGDPIPNISHGWAYVPVSVEAGATLGGLGYFSKTGDDTFEAATGTAESGTQYYQHIESDNVINDDIGTIGNVYGGCYQGTVTLNSTVNIGTETTVRILKRNTDGEIVDENGNQVYDAGGKLITGMIPAFEDKPVIGAHITGDVFGGGELADVGIEYYEDDQHVTQIRANGGTSVNICAKGTAILDEGNQPTGDYNYTAVNLATQTDNYLNVTIGGNVFGGGKGLASNFKCDQAMAGRTNVLIGNGTVGTIEGGKLKAGTGNVYGGGEVGRVEENTKVTIGLTPETGETSAPEIKGSVFGAGQGVATHGYSALVRGKSEVFIQEYAKVGQSVYGGGELASVGRYQVGADGMPQALFDASSPTSGYCYVTIGGHAEIGPDNMQMTASGGPIFSGHVFGAGKGVLPYKTIEGGDLEDDPWRMKPNNEKQWFAAGRYVREDTQKADYKEAYLDYIETLALATQTIVIIGGDAFVKGSVYGGSENGIVQHDTQVTIQDNCQIGAGQGKNTRHESSVWEADYSPTDGTDLECAHWPYGEATNDSTKHVPYDKYADTSGYTSYASTTGDDGHTFYGNVFGGGSGYFPYAAGKWHWAAGAVYGNTNVTVTGGHILTNLYGGNEMTNVGKGASDLEHGICTINFGGTATLGVPRTLTQIANHPVTCYLFGGGKGDQRVLFNKQTNVNDAIISITGGTIYGSVFGGGEDGHVLRNVTMTIGDATTTTDEGGSTTTTKTGPMIGTWGTSYVDGNVFGGGRGFGGDAYTAGNVGGSITMEIKGGTMLGSIYGGGRLGSVGYGLYSVTETDSNNKYGVMQDDGYSDYYLENGTYKRDAITGFKRGYVTITISGGKIGNDYEYIIPTESNITAAGITQKDISKWKAESEENSEWTTWKNYHHVPYTVYDTSNGRLLHTKGGNVFAGGMGRRTQLDNITPITSVDWTKLGNVKSTTVNISGDPWIMGNVYGGGEFGAVTGSHPAKDAGNNNISVGTEVEVTGGIIGTEITETTPQKATITTAQTVKYTFGSVYGGGMGAEEHDENENHGGDVKSSTKVSLSGADTEVRASVFGGGEMAATDGNTHVVVSNGKIGRNEVQPLTSSNPGYVMFGGATMGNVYGGGKGHVNHTLAGVVKGNTNINMSGGYVYHNIYGGGALASVGTFGVADSQNSYVPEGVPFGWTAGGTANVTITGGTIGISGRDNGMVNGSSRGGIAKPVATTFNNNSVYKDPYDKVAWVNKSVVTIGTSNASTGPTVKGSVYGGGENGHNASDAQVTVYSGKIGIFAEEDWDDFGVEEINAKALITRGNVYGAGCGTDTYWDDADNDGVVDAGEEHHNLWSGIVAGNTIVTVSGGHVSNNVYGGGSMGSVGTIISDLDDTQKQHKTASTVNKETYYSFGLSWPLEIDYLNTTGLASVTIDGTAQIDGSVFGSTRGIVELGESDIEKHRYVEAKFANVRETQVVIGTAEGTGKTNPQIGHSVYGGGEDGHVYENASVTIYHGKIGRSVYGGGRGEGTFSTTLWKASGSSHENVESPKTHSWTAGRVYGNTTVTMYDGSVGWFIYGGGDLGSVGKGNYAGGQDDYATGGYGELPSDGGNLWTATTGFKPDEDIDETNHPTTMADYFLSSGKSTVNLFGGEVGSSSGALINNENKSYDDDGVPYGSVFGGSRGKAAATCKESPRYRYVPDFFLGYVNRAIINIGGTSESSTVSGTGPTIYGSVYGGGQDGHVRNSTEVKIYKGNISGQDASVDEAGRSGHVFGAGSGIGTYDTGVIKDGKHVMACNNASGSVTCTTLVEVYGENSNNASTATTKINGNVYGGGAMASVGPPRTIQTYDEYEAAEGAHQSHTCTQVNIKGGRIGGSVFAASRGPSDAFRQQSFEGKGIDYDPLSFATVLWPNVHVSGGVIGAGEDGGSVFGGGETGYVKCGVDVNILGGTIKTDVYGGGARAHTNTSNLEQDRTTSVWSWTDATNKTAKYTTTVNLLGGTIEGDAYGGGLGRREYGEKGQTGYESAASALVFGNVKVNLNGLEQEDYDAFNTNTHASTTGFSTRLEQISTDDYQIKDNVKGAVVKRIFGCNNLLGSPQGKVRVHVFGTQNSAATQIANTPAVAASGDTPAVTEVTDAKVDGRYDMEAVYGGANLAAYMPMGPNALSETATDIDNLTTDYKNTTQSTEVIIDGCHRTSIEEVYGGGNAAPVPATNLVVNGTYEIFEAFGGGNGLDKYYLKEGTSIVWYQNPGANVGYRDFTEKGTGSGETEDDPILAKDKSDAATKEMRQATYGYGSGVATTDIKGGRIHNVYGGSNKRGNIRTTALSLYEGVNDDCPMDVDESYGAGKDAPIDGEVDMRMRCAHGVKEIFGGSKNSDVNSDINLTITNGSSLERVFGGNNTSGAIAGSITVNIEEGGCEPIIIKELYAGGYLAPYSIYGYESDGRGGYLKKPEDYGGDIGTINQAQPLTKKRYEEDIKPTYEGYMTADLTALKLTASATNEDLETKIAELRVIANDTQKTEKERDDASALIDKALEVIAIRQLLASYPKKDPRINVISATRIDNIFGGGYRALVVGSPHVNVNMTNGRVEFDNYETSGTYVDAKGTTYSSVYPETKYHVTVNGTKVEVKKMEMTTEIESQLPTVDTNDYKEAGDDKTYVYINGNTFYKVSNVTSSTKYYATLDIGTIGNIYGGGNLADIDGNTYVEIGTGKWLTWDASGNPVWEATDADGNTYTSSQTGNAVNYTQTECNAYNATLSGYIPSGVKLTSDQASAVNTALGLTGDNAYNADDEIYTEDAALYNATLSGYWSTSTVKTQAVYYTQAEIDAAQEGDDAYGKKPTDIKTPTVYYTQAECNEHNYSSDPVNVVGIIACTTALTAKKAVAVNEAISTSYASGDKIYTEDAVAYNATLNGYLTTADVKTAAVWTWSDASNVTATQPTSVRKAATITGNVFGGGKGKADTFTCEKAMVGVDGEGVANPEGGTNVTIANGTVEGNVYGGGEIARVEKNTMVTIGVEANDAPVIDGDVFGAGQGVETHGYSALVRGNPTVIIQGKAQVKGSVYGGGEIASVARYKVVDGSPVALANKTSGNCKVIIRDNAEIGPDGMKMYHEDEEHNPLPPHDTGHVFGAGKGVLPKIYSYADSAHMPKRMLAYDPTRDTESNKDLWGFTDDSHQNIWQYFPTEAEYLGYIETLALSSKTDVTIGGNAFVKGSVYGGSLNGIVQYNTHVTIQGHCQIGQGDEILTRYEDYSGGNIFESNTPPIKTAANETESAVYYDLECAHWDYDNNSGATYDEYAKYLNAADGKYYYDAAYTQSARDGSYIAKDGHTYYGNVFGGGSGVIPYAPGKWHRASGVVRGNTVVDITGGHILTSIYGGNEQTDVGIYDKDFYNNNEPTIPKSGGLCTVNFGGTATLGVPRTLNQIAAHPVTCYLFGAGKGDMRTFFNTWTNIREAEVNVTGGKIYGSVFGGGEDGHVLEDVTVNISNPAMIGTTGTSSVDGNVFGAGRGFSGEAITAGSVGGNVEVNISGGTMLGSVYGGGRLASVGIGFNAATSSHYGQYTEDGPVKYTQAECDSYNTANNLSSGNEGYRTTDDIKIPAGKTFGHVTVNISGGTIGNNLEVLSDAKNSHTKGGNVFGGSMGRLELLNGDPNPLWPQLGQVKTATVNISGANTVIKSNVYGGGEMGTVRDNTTVNVSNGTVERDVYGGGYGSSIIDETYNAMVETLDQNDNPMVFGYNPMKWAGMVGQETNVNISGGRVKKSVYGGGEMASVGIINYVLKPWRDTEEAAKADGNVIFKNPVTNKFAAYANIVKHADEKKSFALSWPYKYEYFPGYGGKTNVIITGGRIGLTSAEDNDNTPNPFADKDNGDVYGSGKGIAGNFNDYIFCANVGSTEVTINYNPEAEGTILNPATYKAGGDCVAGAVYGGGENGHVMGDTKVTLTNGLIGHSIYGGGSGKGQFNTRLLKIGATVDAETGEYKETDYYNRDIYSISAGKVFGNTNVTMTGGLVIRNVYGGGNMGSVGKGNYAGGADDYSNAGYGETLSENTAADDKTLWNGSNEFSLAFLSSGKCTVNITGGTVGYIDPANPSKSMYPLNDNKEPYDASLPYGNVFGGCRGESAPNILESPRYLYSPEFFVGYANETDVTIGTSGSETGPRIYGSVYGGGMDGHIRRDTHVTINSGEIGSAFTEQNAQLVQTNDLNNVFWLARGNVYGAGSGIGKYRYDFNYDDDTDDNGEDNDHTVTYKGNPIKEEDYSTSAGSVTRFTKVEVNGGTIHRNVYGGGSLSSVGPPAIPTDREETAYKEGVTKRGDGTDAGPGWWSQCEVIIKSIIGSPTYDPAYGGEVYGASRGDIGLGESFGNVVWTLVKILNGANIKGNVFGGGDNGIVKQDTDVQIGEAQE